jgi:uncharacterized protein YifE (UPF0438 family)
MTDELTDGERRLINAHGNFYASLVAGERVPTTEKQKHFIAVCRGLIPPSSDHEFAYLKYLAILEKRRQISAADSGPETLHSAPPLDDGIGQRAYPPRMDKTLEDARIWGKKNGFRL